MSGDAQIEVLRSDPTTTRMYRAVSTGITGRYPSLPAVGLRQRDLVARWGHAGYLAVLCKVAVAPPELVASLEQRAAHITPPIQVAISGVPVLASCPGIAAFETADGESRPTVSDGGWGAA